VVYKKKVREGEMRRDRSERKKKKIDFGHEQVIKATKEKVIAWPVQKLEQEKNKTKQVIKLKKNANTLIQTSRFTSNGRQKANAKSKINENATEKDCGKLQSMKNELETNETIQSIKKDEQKTKSDDKNLPITLRSIE
jgi:hypothetical protein